MKKTLYFDCETTGLDPKRHDIFQMSGFVDIDGEIKESFNYTVQPMSFANISPEALEITGKTVDELRSYPDRDKVWEQFVDMLGRYCDKYNRLDKFYMAGYNVRFDADFLKEFFLKNKDFYFGSWFNYRFIDPLPLLHWANWVKEINLPDYKLATVCRHFQIPLQAHDAMADITATRELIYKLLDKTSGKDQL